MRIDKTEDNRRNLQLIVILEECVDKEYIEFELSQNVKLRLYLRMETFLIRPSKEIIKIEKEELELSLVKQFTLTKEFMMKVTTLRRVGDDLEYVLQIPNFKGDFQILIWGLVLLYFPCLFIISFLVYVYLVCDLFGMVQKITKKFIYYFSKFRDSDDEKKNLLHVQKSQQSSISFS